MVLFNCWNSTSFFLVSFAIHEKAGLQLPVFLTSHHAPANCSYGDCFVTPAFKLHSKFIIHTVGPVHEDSEILAQCYRSCLNLMVENGCRTIAFPSISTGILSLFFFTSFSYYSKKTKKRKEIKEKVKNQKQRKTKPKTTENFSFLRFFLTLI